MIFIGLRSLYIHRDRFIILYSITRIFFLVRQSFKVMMNTVEKCSKQHQKPNQTVLFLVCLFFFSLIEYVHLPPSCQKYSTVDHECSVNIVLDDASRVEM